MRSLSSWCLFPESACPPSAVWSVRARAAGVRRASKKPEENAQEVYTLLWIASVNLHTSRCSLMPKDAQTSLTRAITRKSLSWRLSSQKAGWGRGLSLLRGGACVLGAGPGGVSSEQALRIYCRGEPTWPACDAVQTQREVCMDSQSDSERDLGAATGEFP